MIETHHEDLEDFYKEQQDIKNKFLDKLVELVVEIKVIESKDTLTDKKRKRLVQLRTELNTHIFSNI
jgi:hypothetical protein